MSEVKKAPAKKGVGNKTTEIIVGAAASKLEYAVKGIQSAVIEVANLENKVGDYTLKIVNLEDQIGGLKQDLDNQKAQNKLELEISFKSDRASFVDIWLQENKFVTISQVELDKMKTDLNNATQNLKANIQEAVSAATSSMKSTHENEKKVLDLEYKTKEANNLAKIEQLESKVTFLSEQCEMWKDALEAERRAGIERSKYGAINTLNVGNGQQGK